MIKTTIENNIVIDFTKLKPGATTVLFSYTILNTVFAVVEMERLAKQNCVQAFVSECGSGCCVL